MGTRKSFTAFTLDNAWNVEFPTKPAGVLRLGPGPVRLAARFSERARARGFFAATVIECELRLADADGKLWQARGGFLSECLLPMILDLARPEPPRWLHNAPPSWRTALATPLIRKQPYTEDNGLYRCLWIDSTGITWHYSAFTVDFTIAALSERELVAQVGGVHYLWWPLPLADAAGAPLPVPPARTPAQQEEWMRGEFERLQAELGLSEEDPEPPLAFLVDASRLLFRNTALEDMEGWFDLPTSDPLVFRRIPGSGEPQRIVAFHKRQHLSAPPPSDEDASFIRLEVNIPLPLEFATDAGGNLQVDGSLQPLCLNLDRHPGSVGAEEVLRSRLRLTDVAGDVWETGTLFTPEVFFEKLLDLKREAVPDVESSDEPWSPGPGSLLGVRGRLVGGWRYAVLARHLIAFHGEEQRPLFDLCPLGDVIRVRLRGLVGRCRPIQSDGTDFDLNPAPDAEEVTSWEQDHELPPVCFSVALLDVVFRNTTFAVDEGFWHGNAIPIPVVFTRIGKAEPNSTIRFAPEAAT
jgi:hypothetical protein